MTVPFDRRRFLATGSAFAALAASGCSTRMASTGAGTTAGFGPLLPDPNGFFDLPEGFSYRVLSSLGDAMSDGGTVPDKADGMGCFDLDNGEIALVRNHELVPDPRQPAPPISKAYGTAMGGKVVLPGGTTTIVLDARTLAVKRQFRSLGGTIRNCAGGTTPWGSWLTCEEFVNKASGPSPIKLEQTHGWVFEVPARARALVDPVPLKAMGRFNHEAACVDPRTGVVYMTEDRDDSLLYRFIPSVRGKLAQGGRLQALALANGIGDTRNWGGVTIAPRSWHPARWIDLTNVESPEDDLRKAGAGDGAAVFARGEGIHMGDDELYFTCTSGGTAKLGQVFRLSVGAQDKLQLFYESTDPEQFNFGDNLTIAPFGDLVVCEDQYTDPVSNHLRGITPEGVAYPLALLHAQTELAGACFSPDGRTLFVNAYAPTRTLAITGPWNRRGRA